MLTTVEPQALIYTKADNDEKEGGISMLPIITRYGLKDFEFT